MLGRRYHLAQELDPTVMYNAHIFTIAILRILMMTKSGKY